MDLQLWRWSTAVQLSSAFLIALFFVLLTRSTRRVELRLLVCAWIANFCALGTTLVFWFPAARTDALLVLIRYPYIFFKSAFILLIIAGAVGFGRRSLTRTEVQRGALGLALYTAVVGTVVRSLDGLGVLVPTSIAIAFTAATVFLARQQRSPGGLAIGWLALGFLLRGTLAVLEASAHATMLLRGPDALGGAAQLFVGMSSAFDAGAEWLIALGCVLALYDTIGSELTCMNADLVRTREELRSLAQRDPLTGVLNRRRLPDIMNDSRATGATILFFDLDDFKDINDVHGHHVGDEALRRFARVLQASFRPADHVIRYAGDEFIVVGQGIAQVDVRDRIAVLRETLRLEHAGGPEITFAVGEAYLPIGGDPDAAIRAADAAMYRRKGHTKRLA